MSASLKSILSEMEREERNRLEAEITTVIGSFLKVGTALLEIAEKRLYRETHGSFEPYCQDKWGMSARHAYRLCEAAKVIKSLPTDQLVAVKTESVARELAKVPLEKRAEVLQKAGDKPTAKAIREAAKPAIDSVENNVIPISADDQFRKAMGFPTSDEMKSELEMIQREFSVLVNHILDADLTGEDYQLLAKQLATVSVRLDRIGKSKCAERLAA